ncbi:MAG: class B sortase [Cohnella sp.]|nr:class B sortase [Cohnella sp.]
MSRTSKAQWLWRLSVGLCIAGMIGSAWVLISANREYARGDNAYEQVRRLKETTMQPSLPSTKPQPVSDARLDPVTRAAKVTEVDFAALARVNPDVVAWIKARDSAVDYPVVQGKDNSYYLKHLFTGKENGMGSPFVDYRTPGDFSGDMTIIYGHHMKNGSMFAPLAKYKKQAYYDAHPVMELYTPEGDYAIELFAGMIANGSDEFLRRDFEDDDDYLAYIDTLKDASTFRSNVTVRSNERIVALVTCSYEYSNARYAVFGKLTPLAV